MTLTRKQIVEAVDPRDLSEYAKFIIAHHGFTIDSSGCFTPNPKLLTEENIVTLLYESYLLSFNAFSLKFKKKNGMRKVDYHHFKRVIDLIKNENVGATRAAIYETVKSNGQSELTQLNQYVTALIGTPDSTIINVLAHWISNVKRKMSGQSVTYQIMPVFTGKQKGGKSTAIRHLLSPLGEGAHETTLTAALKPESFTLVSQYFAIFFDEMEGVHKSSISAIKKMVTEERAGGRLYYTQKNVNVRNVASFIGTSNDALLDLIDDKTGARRFFEVKCSDKINWKMLKEIDYLQVWREVNEENGTYYLKVETEIEKAQENLVSIDLFAMFINETHLRPTEGSKRERVTTEMLYKIYCTWLEPYKVQPLHPTSFFKKLLGLGFKKESKTLTLDGRPRRTYTFYMISTDSQFAQEALNEDKSILARLKKEYGE